MHKQKGQSKEVMHLSTRERILTIRLLEKLERDPAFAAALGLETAEPSEETA